MCYYNNLLRSILLLKKRRKWLMFANFRSKQRLLTKLTPVKIDTSADRCVKRWRKRLAQLFLGPEKKYFQKITFKRRF